MSMAMLKPDFFSKTFFLDRNRDGIVDALGLHIHLQPSAARSSVLCAVMDLCAGLGFETMAMDLPLVQTGNRRDPSVRHHLYIGDSADLAPVQAQAQKGDIFIAGEDETALARAVRTLTFSLMKRDVNTGRPQPLQRDPVRRGFDLSNPFSIHGFYAKSSVPCLPNFLLYRIVLMGAQDLETAIAAANFAARLGLETTGLFWPLTFTWNCRPIGKPCIFISAKEDWTKIKPENRPDLFQFEWDAGLLLIPSSKKIPDLLICGQGPGLKQALDRLAFLPMNSAGVQDSCFKAVKHFQERIQKHLSAENVPLKGRRPKKISRSCFIADERHEIRELLKQSLKRLKAEPHQIEVQAFIARPKKARVTFAKELKPLLRSMGVRERDMTVSVLNAYKPGLSWIREEVLKKLIPIKVDRLEIAFRPFKENGLEEETRWLQELFPIDELLALALDLPKEKIKFKMSARQKSIYRLRAWQAGALALEAHFSPYWVGQPYLNAFPAAGRVHPCAGWLCVRVAGNEWISRHVPTGPQRIWSYYQKELLPLIAGHAGQILTRRSFLSSNPLFEELRLDIHFDYAAEPLGLDEERLSPLEALHEDLYFVTLDFFKRWARKQGRPALAAGRVVPVIHPALGTGKERMTFTLILPAAEPALVPENSNEEKLSIDGILFQGSRPGFSFFKEEAISRHGRRIMQKIESFACGRDHSFSIDSLSMSQRAGCKGVRGFAFLAPLSRTKPAHEKRIRDLSAVPLTKPIGYQENLEILRSFAGKPGLEVIEEGCSTGGLRLFSIAITHPCPSAFVSQAKQAAFKPTLFINCRHHANEISSTNAGLYLARLLAVNPVYRKLLKKINVVINPLENADGVVITEEMLQWTPTDKLHAGRYNQAGREYYSEYFRPRTVFGEAKVKPAVWQRWLPEICCDDHGFPSHEWEQPFSGYVPWQFRDWWIPRSLFFVYLPFLDEESASPQRSLAEGLKKQLISAFHDHVPVQRWNRSFSERYWKYREYWIGASQRTQTDIQCLPLAKRFQKSNFAYRFPEVTTMDLITEVADETASKGLLKTCIAAHLQCNLALIKLLSSGACRAKRIQATQGRETLFIWGRERALAAATPEKKKESSD
jgi:hypothetical protein